jgi:hypothetical protein
LRRHLLGRLAEKVRSGENLFNYTYRLSEAEPGFCVNR